MIWKQSNSCRWILNEYFIDFCLFHVAMDDILEFNRIQSIRRNFLEFDYRLDSIAEDEAGEMMGVQ